MIFNPFERMVAFRYLRARRQEGFVSVIAIFSLLGIALGVATLIIVMAVMNGFRAELLGKILGINGHLAVIGAANNVPDYDKLAQQVQATSGVVAVIPQVEGQVMATKGGQATGALIRGVRPEDLPKFPSVAGGTPREIVDKLEQWHFETGANGGFMLARGFSAPGNLQEFVDLVVPELQRRGLSKKKYAGATLRENLL